jgi:hypothetical protein
MPDDEIPLETEPEGAAPPPPAPPARRKKKKRKGRPSANGSDGRDDAGRFVAGNAFGHGNPFLSRVSRLRAAFYDAMTEKEVAALVRATVNAAKKGDGAARALVLRYALGSPPDVPWPCGEIEAAIQESQGVLLQRIALILAEVLPKDVVDSLVRRFQAEDEGAGPTQPKG